MNERRRLEPTASHPITVEPADGRVVVRVGDVVVADSGAALILREADYPPVHYIPLVDVRTDRLRRSETATYCPFKGDATYYSVLAAEGDTAVEDAGWTYEQPYPAVAEIAGHVAFSSDRAQISVG